MFLQFVIYVFSFSTIIHLIFICMCVYIFQSKPFWILAQAVKEFVHNEGKGAN